VKPAPAPKVETERRVSEEPPYKVILHNDDYTPMEHVVEVLRKVIPRMSVRRAVDIMLEAHTKGKAVVTKTHHAMVDGLAHVGCRSDPNLLIVDPRLPDVSDGLSMLVSLQDNRPHLRLVLIGWRDGLGSETGLASAAHVSKSAAPDEFVRAILSACEPETPS
jgi:ATP-dependent Clp protease adaptor protein ClpS